MNNHHKRWENNYEGHGLAGEKKRMAMKYYNKSVRKERRRLKAVDSGSRTTATTSDHLVMSSETLVKSSTNVNKKRQGGLNVETFEQQRRLQLQAESRARLAAKEKREAAVLKRKETRLEKFKGLSRRTKKGQPIMKHRMTLLLKQIEQQVCK